METKEDSWFIYEAKTGKAQVLKSRLDPLQITNKNQNETNKQNHCSTPSQFRFRAKVQLIHSSECCPWASNTSSSTRPAPKEYPAPTPVSEQRSHGDSQHKSPSNQQCLPNGQPETLIQAPPSGQLWGLVKYQPRHFQLSKNNGWESCFLKQDPRPNACESINIMQFNVFIQRIAQWIVGRSRLKLGSIRNLIENVDTGSNFAIIFHVLSMQEFIRCVPLIPTGDSGALEEELCHIGSKKNW